MNDSIKSRGPVASVSSMTVRVTYPWHVVGVGIIMFCLGLGLSPVIGYSQDINQVVKEDVKVQLRRDWEKNRPKRPKVGRNIVEGLQAGKKYSTFLAIADRAGLIPLLQGTVSDSTNPTILFVEDSVKLPKDGIYTVKILDASPEVNATKLKSDLTDQLRDFMGETLKLVVAEEGLITVFTPTDEAFAKLSRARLDSLRTDSLAAAEFVRAHILNRGVYRDAFGKLRTITTLGGSTLRIGAKTSTIATINGSVVIDADIAADNGVAHGIDAILDLRATPPVESSTPNTP